jgi:hypothetical protein
MSAQMGWKHEFSVETTADAQTIWAHAMAMLLGHPKRILPNHQVPAH